LILALGMPGCALVGSGGSGTTHGHAYLRDANGNEVGRATLRENADKTVTVEVTTTGVAAGTHGIHIHALSQCVGPAFTSAGGHFNPAAKMHGLSNPAGAHNGDLANLEVGASGRATYSSVTNRVTLSAGPTSVFDADGSAIVIHATADDQMTDPSGNSGARIACGIIQPD
jgi:Cu-Zn family superoxide dismutase